MSDRSDFERGYGVARLRHRSLAESSQPNEIRRYRGPMGDEPGTPVSGHCLERSAGDTDVVPRVHAHVASFDHSSDGAKERACQTGNLRILGDETMPKHEGADHHHKAAEHHEKAAHHHREAAKNHEAGDHEDAAHHAHSAHGHASQAAQHHTEASRHYTEKHSG
jgi:hypothetical protein